ncbi:MAG: ABC transporter permease [Firmicutes bacterium]|nr:ABC transporter permease [Bacillota bacterium]
MGKYILKRLGAMLLTLFFVMVLSFMIVRLMPMNIFENPETPKAIQDKLNEQLHLNEPIPIQLFYFLKGIVTDLNFGTSVKIRPGAEVFSLIATRIPPTVVLNIFSLIISIPIGLIAGIIAALKRNTWIDTVISFLIVVFISVPSFIFASVLQYGLTYAIPIFPTLYDSRAPLFWGGMYSMVLPIIALALGPIATIARYLRAELIENMSSEYLLLARTKGLTRMQAIVRHGFRNSLIPIANTLIGLLTGIMGGSLVIENIFAVPGMGAMLVNSINTGDHFLTVALLIFYSTISLCTILIVDLSYGIIDPRVRVGGGAK